MDIHTAAHYMRHGYRIRRSSLPERSYLYSKDNMLWEFSVAGHLPTYLLLEDLLANDWELITDGIIKHFPLIYSD